MLRVCQRESQENEDSHPEGDWCGMLHARRNCCLHCTYYGKLWHKYTPESRPVRAAFEVLDNLRHDNISIQNTWF